VRRVCVGLDLADKYKEKQKANPEEISRILLFFERF